MGIIERLHNNKISKNFSFLTLSLLFSVFSLQAQESSSKDKGIVHSVYITSNTGLRSNESNQKILKQIVEASKKGDSSSLVIIGNLVPKEGFPDKDNGRDKAEQDLQKNLLDKISDFKVILFLPLATMNGRQMHQIILTTWSLFFRIIPAQNSGLTMAVL